MMVEFCIIFNTWQECSNIGIEERRRRAGFLLSLASADVESHNGFGHTLRRFGRYDGHIMRLFPAV